MSEEVDRALKTAERLKKLIDSGEYCRLDYDDEFITLAAEVARLQAELEEQKSKGLLEFVREQSKEAHERAEKAEAENISLKAQVADALSVVNFLLGSNVVVYSSSGIQACLRQIKVSLSSSPVGKEEGGG